MIREGARVPALIVAASVLVLALLGAAVVANLEKIEVTVRNPPGREARANPYLAAERLLSRMGLRVVSTARLEKLPPTDRVIVLAAESRVLTEVRTRRLLDWVSKGGYLILGPYLEDGRMDSETSNDPLLDELGVIVEAYEDVAGRPQREVVEMENPNAVGEFMDVEFFSDFALTAVEDDPEEGYAYALVWREVGEGLVAVLNDLRFVRSEEIGKHAHARYFWELVRYLDEREDVLLVYGVETDSIWALLLRHAWLPLAVGSLWLIAWTWRSATRFGPRIPTPEHGSRAVTEHVEALGYFLWRANRADTFVSDARRALERKILARKPKWAVMDREEKLHELSVHSGIEPGEIHSALYAGHASRREEFTRTIRTLEQLRRAL